MSVVNSLKKKFTIDWRQQDCIDKLKFKKKTSPNVRIFAFEDQTFKEGCRKFIIAGLRDFYLWYRGECPQHQKHFYELILESTPCRLYFDLEFLHEYNNGLDGIALVQEFCEIASHCLWELLGVQLDAKKHFLTLDSSSSTKFSAHIIVHIPNSMDGPDSPKNERIFPDNISIKRIVMYICSKLLQENKCLIKKGNEPHNQTFFCDMSVYSRNRNFRLYQSSKFGKAETLKRADYCHFYESRSTCPMHAQIFLDSLVIPLNYPDLPIFDTETLPNLSSLKSTLESCKRMLDHEEAIVPYSSQQQNLNKGNTAGTAIPNKFGKTVELAGGPAPSPLPELDTFMLKIFRRFNSAAKIRVWRFICNYQEEGEQICETKIENKKVYQLQYQLTDSRYCMNRGREHKSQNVYWVADLTEFYFVQRCFDKIDCPSYVSPAFAFPNEICKYMHSAIEAVFSRFRIRQVLPDLTKLLAKRYKAVSDSFNKSIEWREKYGNIDFLELLTPCDAYDVEEEESVVILERTTPLTPQ